MQQAQLERDQARHFVASPLYTKDSQRISSSVDSQKDSLKLEGRLPLVSSHTHEEPRHPISVAERDPPRALFLPASNHKPLHRLSQSHSNDRISQHQATNFDKRNNTFTQSVSFLPQEVSSSYPDILQRTQAWASASANPSHHLKSPKQIIISSTSVKAVAFEFERNHIQKARDSVEHKRNSLSSKSSFSKWTEVPHRPITSPNSDSATDISFGSTYYPTSPGNKFFESSSANVTKTSPLEEDVEIISSHHISRGYHIDMDARSFLHFDSSESIFSNRDSQDLKPSTPIHEPNATSSKPLTTNPYFATSHKVFKDSSSESLPISTTDLSGKLNVSSEHNVQSISTFSVSNADDNTTSCRSETSSPTFMVPGHFSTDSVSVVEDELDDDWEDAVEDDNVFTPVNYNSINTTVRTYGFASTSSSDTPETAQALKGLIGVELKRRSLIVNQKTSPYVSSSLQNSRLRSSVISMLSIVSRSSDMSQGVTDDGGEFEDADDQAEWMDIDGGGAYEDLDKAQEITREVSRQLIVDSAQALKKATEARNRYSALTEAYHANDILFTPMGGPLSKRISTQVPKDYFNCKDCRHRSNSITSSSAISGRGSCLSDRCDCEVHDRCGSSSSSSQQRDSMSSRGSRSSRVMLFTRNSKPGWISRSEEAGELGPIVEVENGSDEQTRNLSASPSTLEQAPSHVSVDPLTGQPRWRPRPLFLKPVGVKTPPGPSKRPISESPSGSFSDHDPTNGKRWSRQHRQLSKCPSFASAKESTIHESPPSPRPISSESSATSISHETAITHAEVLWPFPPPTSRPSLNVCIAQSSQDPTNQISPERKVFVPVKRHLRPHTANTTSNSPRPFGASPPVTLRRLQSLSGEPLTNLKDRKPIKYSTRSNSRVAHQSNRSKSTRTQPKNKLDLSVLSTIVNSEARVLLARSRSNTLLDASYIANGMLSRSDSKELHVRPFIETGEKRAGVKSRKNILRPDTSSGWTVCDAECESDEDLDPFARVPGVLMRPHTANPIRRTHTTSSTSSQHTHKGKQRSLTGTDLNKISKSEELERPKMKKISASATNLRESPLDGYRPDSSSTDEVDVCVDSSFEGFTRPIFPTRPVRPLRMDEDLSVREELLLDVKTAPPRERSQTFGRPSRNNASQKPLVMVLKQEEPVELPLPTGLSVGITGVDGLEQIKHRLDLHKGVPVSPISSLTLGTARDEGSMKPSVSRPSSGGLQPGLPHSPQEISYNPKDATSSHLSLWPSWAGREKGSQNEPSPSPTLSASTSTFTFHSSARARLYSHGNSTVMESVYEPDYIPESSSSTQLSTKPEWEKGDGRSVKDGDAYTSVEQANEMKLFYSDNKQSSVLNFKRESTLAKMKLLDVQRDPVTEVEDRRPASFIIGGRTKLISGPIRLDQATQTELLWKMINGAVSSEGRLSINQKKKKTEKKKRGLKFRL
ncbi:hypothetical protein DFH28DRAFT_923431 [Melampsora americana]|nr:hypothetical protein DFH28DRAFT_923431 [Melampsora americana]